MKFGTSGLRGLVSEMTDPVCAGYVRAFLGHLGSEAAVPGDVLVGQDLRPSSGRIAAACCGAIEAHGWDAVDCGIVPTPALALEAARGVPAIMVTGSHIPFDRNGLKFYRPGGEITKADEAGIQAARAMPAPAPATAGSIRQGRGIAERYIARYVDFFGPGCLGGLRVGLYQHSAAGRDLMRDALGRLGAEVVAIGRTDGFVPIDTEAIAPEDAARVRQWVREHRLAALVSTDGDGDRPLVADETGSVIRGDMLGTLTARLIGADAVATPISSSTALERSGWFASIIRTRIGSPYVVDAIAELKAGGARLAVGYEANGGFLLGGAAVSPDGRRLEALPTRDAMVPIVALLAAMAKEGRTASDLAAELPARATASDRLQEVAMAFSSPLFEALATDDRARSGLLSGLGAAGIGAVDTLDGVRMTLADGDIVHLRMSGNAPELRCYCEAATPERAGELVREVLGRVERMRSGQA